MIPFRPLALVFFFICHNSIIANSQEPDIKFYDIIRDDSVVMYFSNAFNFTEMKCAGYRRYTSIDSFGDFYKSFTDLDTNGHIFGKGYYKEGLKDGDFEIFYPNGSIKAKGKYKKGLPSGEWMYYYPDGKPERKLLINMADTFLIDAYNDKGEQTVTGGKGFFEGEVFGNDRFFNTIIIAKGEVVNGKPEGQWLSFLRSSPYCKEHYINGVFDYGTFSSIFEKNKKYTDRHYLDKFFLSSYIESLDQFKMARCLEIRTENTTVTKKNTQLDLGNFRSFVNDAIGRVMESDFRTGAYNDYIQGDNIFKLSFKLKDDGTPINFKKMTSWGDQYFTPITNALSMHAKFPASSQTIYFHMVVIKSPSSNVSYKFKLSADADDGF